MAFPTSSLTNNQVHKEGNRAFVYDSALGVWDQVRETDRTENKILSGEVVGGVVTFPAGHMRFLAHSALTTIATGSVTSQTEMPLVSLSTGTFTAGSKILLFGSGNVSQASTSTSYYAYIFFNGVSASTGTASDTGLTSSFNNAIATEVGYQVASSHYSSDYAGTQLVTPLNGATECTYHVAYKTAQAQTDNTYFYRTRIALYEIYQ